jgi:hypothetical protein
MYRKTCQAQYDTLSKQVLSDKRLFLNGEFHLKEKNNEVNLFLLKYYYKNAKVRVLLMEMGYTSGYLLNQYLISGDQSLLNSVDILPPSTAYFKSLRAFYQSLPEDEKFVVQGVDREFGIYGFTEALGLLFHDSIVPTEISLLVESFKKENMYDGSLTKKYVYLFYVDLLKHEASYRTYLKDDFYHFRSIIYSQMFSPYFGRKRFDSREDFYRARELFMYENILRVINEYPGVNYYGSFGALHVSTKDAASWSSVKEWKSLASMLNNVSDSPVRSKVFSSVIYYENFKRRTLESLYILEKSMERYEKEKSDKVRFLPYIPSDHFGTEKVFVDYIMLPNNR